ncbi:hypothetical protein TSOC_007820 [Tetrabaena socialis]|uniref:Uncharacterized protein n=1 Tax=Tetrabaena socialis TaxID=47790 RepID=A0A2J8A033_9CHLO|nr:hypothetical protein TSOC_007820 [Tetrabaena socialis]|eukprot:PNH05883.1 hypothetical protein TSOC_007820 [Tetrabaena socialis]
MSDSSESLAGAVRHSPPVLDAQDRTPPHGERVKRSPQSDAVSPNVELVDMSTEEMREHGLAERVAADKPVLDEQGSTPYHTTDKAGVHDLTAELQGGGHRA